MKKKSKSLSCWEDFEIEIKGIIEDRVKASVELLHYNFNYDKDVKAVMCKFGKYYVQYAVAYINEYDAIDEIYIFENRVRAFCKYLFICFDKIL